MALKSNQDKYFQDFKRGAADFGVSEIEARNIWDHINTMGAYAFNKSHAVAYAIVSYYCCLLKSRFPLEFASATLRNSRDDEQTNNILKELKEDGYSYKMYDREKSEVNWSVKDGELIGGFTMIKGIGPKMAEDMVRRRSMKQIFTPRQEELLTGKKRITPANQSKKLDSLQSRLL